MTVSKCSLHLCRKYDAQLQSCCRAAPPCNSLNLLLLLIMWTVMQGSISQVAVYMVWCNSCIKELCCGGTPNTQESVWWYSAKTMFCGRRRFDSSLCHQSGNTAIAARKKKCALIASWILSFREFCFWRKCQKYSYSISFSTKSLSGCI